MTDHRTARLLAATSIDGPLAPTDASALQGHLDTCLACRSVQRALDEDAAGLRAGVVVPVPAALRGRVAAALSEAREPRATGGRSLVVVLGVLLLLGVAFGGMAVGAQLLLGPDQPVPARTTAIDWQTEVARLSADGFAVETGTRRFTASGPVSVSSDPGDATAWTLELIWREHDVEMRMNVYFASDGTTWWIDHLRTYDGHADGDWLFYRAPSVGAPLGQPWAGDLEIVSFESSKPGRGPGRVMMRGAQLAVAPSGEPPPAPGPLAPKPVPGGVTDGETAEIGPVGELRCSGLERQPPAVVDERLRALGYRVLWQVETGSGTSGGGTVGEGAPPDGVITQWITVGRDIVLTVRPIGDPAAVPLAPAADCPAAGASAEPSSGR